MKRVMFKLFIILGLTASAMIWNGNFQSTGDGFIGKADARRGRPATPVSYAGVARRSTVGAGAPGVGVAPGNAGGPVNRVGVRR
jgi:hypothetical protein